MKLEFNFTREELKKYLRYKRRPINFVYLIISTLLYFWINFYMIIKDPITIILGYLILVVVLFVMVFLVNYIYFLIIYNKNKKMLGTYSIKYNKQNFIFTINGVSNQYKYGDIKKIKNTKKYIIIYINNRIFILLKDLFSNDNFNKFIDYIYSICNLKK